MAEDPSRRDSERSRRLLFAPELAAGTLRPSQLARVEVREATRTRRVPSLPSRRYQRRLMRRGALRFERETVERAMAARRAVLGDAAAGPPRLLVRAGAFPHPLADDDPDRHGTARFAAFHEAMVEAGLRYLVAVTPRVSRRPHDPRAAGWRPLADDELEMLARLRRDGVAFAAHGLDHRTRRRGATRRSELAGLAPKALAERLDRAAAELAAVAIVPAVFVPPFDRFDWSQWDELARRFEVVAAGHPSVDALGYHDGPLWRGDAVWMPTYAPLDGPVPQVLAAARALDEAGAALWVGAAFDWSAAAGDPAAIDAARALAAWSTPWEDFLDAVRTSATDVTAHLSSPP